jgi:sugar/nucleoside kinase (ribokinase family)
MSKNVLLSAAQKLRTFDASKKQVLVGLDGFVDNIIDVVDKRIDATNHTRVDLIAQLGERISRAAGLSSNIELVVRQVKLGGNGPIMANAMIEAGFGVTYIGNLGKDSIHPIFADMARRCTACHSLADPAHTDALEFRDGKLMLGKHQSLKEVTYERLVEVVGMKRLEELWGQSHLIALTNWTMLTYQTDIWRKLLRDMEDIKAPKDAILFIDLADPEKRPQKEIADAVKLLKSFRMSHKVVLGVNQKESMEVSNALGLKFNQDEIEQNAVTLCKVLEIDAVVVHPTKNAACATDQSSASLEGPFCQNPKLTTGAGDNFNSGFCAGLLAGLEPAELLACGTATSGFYVRNARSATSKERVGFLEEWAARYGDPAF